MALPATMIKASRPCPISGTSDAYEVCSRDRHGQPLRNIISADSGLIYVDPVPFENTEEFYKTEYRKSYKGVHQPKPKHVYRAGNVALQRFSRLSKLLSQGARCLDAGSSSGEFVYLLRKRGFDAHGVEANLPYAEYSQKELGISVCISPFSEYQTDERFDLITMFHVLEHLENPVRDLSSLAGFLKPDGKLVIEVPNILYPDMSFTHKWHPGHLFSFTDQTLSMLLEKSGFKVISCHPIGDRGNLWGIFELAKRGRPRVQPSLALQNFDELENGRRKYFLNFQNYFKFIPKMLNQLVEKKATNAMKGKEILDELYSG